MVRVRAIIEKTTFLAKLLTKIGKKHFGKASVRIRSKIKKNTLFCRISVRIVVKIEKKHPSWHGLV